MLEEITLAHVIRFIRIVRCKNERALGKDDLAWAIDMIDAVSDFPLEPGELAMARDECVPILRARMRREQRERDLAEAEAAHDELCTCSMCVTEL